MRPLGDERQALRSAFAELGAATWKDAAQHAQVGWDVARVTVVNMARQGGDLQRVGYERPAGSACWMTLYELVQPDDAADDPPPGSAAAAELQSVLASWATFV